MLPLHCVNKLPIRRLIKAQQNTWILHRPCLITGQQARRARVAARTSLVPALGEEEPSAIWYWYYSTMQQYQVNLDYSQSGLGDRQQGCQKKTALLAVISAGREKKGGGNFVQINMKTGSWSNDGDPMPELENGAEC